MANPDRQSSPDIKRSEQGVLNWSFDEVYRVLAVMLLGEYGGNATRLQTDSSGNLKVSDQGSSPQKTLIDKTTTTNVIYIGKAPIGTATSAGAWLISKVDKSGSPISITYADAGASTAVWNDRVSEVYT